MPLVIEHNFLQLCSMALEASWSSRFQLFRIITDCNVSHLILLVFWRSTPIKLCMVIGWSSFVPNMFMDIETKSNEV